MDLWIRSQDKTELIKVVTILEHLNQIYAYDSTSSDGRVVGTYETKERALEVLDEIQNHTILNQCVPPEHRFYEMPKE